jgi:hypothetical protein
MENIAVVIHKHTRQVVYVTTNSRVIPKTDKLDQYLVDPDHQVIVDIQTAKNGKVRTVGRHGQIEEVSLLSLDRTIYRVNLGWSAEMFKQGENALRGVEALTALRVRTPDNRPALLELTTDASAVSPLNTIPEIPADGRSTATIYIQKKSPHGKPLTREEDNDRVVLRTTRGTLSQRQVQLVCGRAQVKLRSSTDTVVADVTAQGENLKRYMLHIEFAPPEQKEEGEDNGPND